MKNPIFLNKQWLTEHLDRVQKRAGQRYTPELNVELPIAEVFDRLSRSTKFYEKIRLHFGKLKKRFRGVSGAYQNKDSNKLYRDFSFEVKNLLVLLERVKEYGTRPIPWGKVRQGAKRAIKVSWKLEDALRKEKKELEDKKMPRSPQGISLGDRVGYDIHSLYEAQGELRYFVDFCESKTALLSNYPFLLLGGLAGSGKTHLLCDVLSDCVKKDYPAILLFGELFRERKDFWTQANTQLGLEGEYSKTKVLKKLNQAGKDKGRRSLILIDALNESQPISYWKKEAPKILKDLKKYPHIALVLSVRKGYEKEVLTKKYLKTFLLEEHTGFQFREWEAVTKFFHSFSLPLPEIPLLLPEFQNPLFLLLFCKAFQDRAQEGRQVFRGHEGATYIFENFVKSVANRIAIKFNLPKGRTNGEFIIWDTVIKRVAEEMIDKKKDRISERDLLKIVSQSHPTVEVSDFLQELERNLLLVKVPVYGSSYKEIEGFDFRFPFQKFSDHLLGRFIFKKYLLVKDTKTPMEFFSKRTKVGKFIATSYNRGLIEALSIQAPEYLDGVEFFEIVPHLSKDLLADPLIQSLVWRTPTAFSADRKDLLQFINKYVATTQSGDYSILNAILSVGSVPGHPFNAEYLHRHLIKFAMADRDSRWSTFLHDEYGEKGAVDRLYEWASSPQPKEHLSNTSIRLCAIALVWFLTSSNRFLRDKTTKALVQLLTPRLSLVVDLLNKFKAVDDPYVLERLYGIAYGCAMRNKKDKEGLKILANLVYRRVFGKRNVYPHILLRDYAKGIVDLAVAQKLIRVDIGKITPPYKSFWPESVPSAKALKKKYYPDLKGDSSKNRGYLDIWSSVMHSEGSLADFGNYIVESALGSWSGRKLNGDEVRRKELFLKFKKSLTIAQRRKIEELNPSLSFSGFLTSLEVVESAKDIERNRKAQAEKKKEKLGEFKRLLSPRKRKYFQKEIEPYLDMRGEITDPYDRFDVGLAERWIFKRVVEMGWRPEIHGEFDKRVNWHQVERTEHKAERLGKKYQWIAFHELLACVSDNYEFIEGGYSRVKNVYSGSWQLVGVRDIDPTFVPPILSSDYPEGIPKIQSFYPNYDDWMFDYHISAWTKTKRSMPDPKMIIEVKDEKGEKWFALKSFVEWQEATPPESEKYDAPTRTVWYMLNSYLIRDADRQDFLSWAEKQSFYGRWMPESSEFYKVFLGEYPSNEAFLHEYVPFYHRDGWTKNQRSGTRALPNKVLVTDDEYTNGGSSRDCSSDVGRNVRLPAKWIIDQMGLQQSYTDGRFFDKRGDLVAFDPSVFKEGVNGCVLIKKDKLLEFLRKKKCTIIWTLLGEKQTIGGGEMGQPYGYREFSGVYALENNKVFGSWRSKFFGATPQKLKKLKKKK